MTTVTTIANETALTMLAAKQAVLIDVREPAEFWEGHLPGAINLPSTQFQVEDYRAFNDLPIHLICQTGNRVRQIAVELNQQGIQNVFLLEQQMEALNDATTAAVPSGWSIDRQFRMTLGLLLAIFLLGYFLVSTWFIIIPIILCAGLTITSAIDRCYLRVGIAMLPWNKKRVDVDTTAVYSYPLTS